MHLDISIGGIKNYFPVLLRELLQHMKRRSGATGDVPDQVDLPGMQRLLTRNEAKNRYPSSGDYKLRVIC